MKREWITQDATLYVAYVPFVNMPGGKNRPVLAFKASDGFVYFFRITSQYASKSPRIRQFYIPLKNWKDFGLRKPSYVDIFNVSKSSHRDDFKQNLGKLSETDRQHLNNVFNNTFTQEALSRVFD